MSSATARERAVVALIAGLGLVGLGVLAIVDPATSAWLPPCPFRALTGWLCPGCGSARAAHALLHGDVLGALRLNPFTPVALATVGGDVALRLWRGTGLPLDRIPAAWLRASVVALVLFAIGRNVLG